MGSGEMKQSHRKPLGTDLRGDETQTWNLPSGPRWGQGLGKQWTETAKGTPPQASLLIQTLISKLQNRHICQSLQVNLAQLSWPTDFPTPLLSAYEEIAVTPLWVLWRQGGHHVHICFLSTLYKAQTGAGLQRSD